MTDLDANSDQPPESITNSAAASGELISGQKSVAITLLSLAAPVIATNISRTVMSFADFVMVSRLGTDAQAAIMPAGIVLFVIIGFGLGVVSVVTTLVSQSYGSGRRADCLTYGWQGVHLGLAIGLAALPMWFILDPFFRLADHGEEILRLEVAYARVGLFGIGPTIAAVALANFFTGIHRPTIGFISAFVSNVFNILCNYALIFGHWGLPAMGMVGAAWSTLMASVLQLLILLGWLMLPRYRQLSENRRTWRPNWGRAIQLIRIGVPAGLQLASDIASWMIFAVFLVGRFGPVHLAANNICFKFLEISFMPAVGLGYALTAAVGKSIGAGKPDQVRIYVRWATIYCVGYMGLIGLVMALFRYELSGLFANDPEIIHWASIIMIMCAVFQIFDALGITYNGALRGAGDPLWPAAAWAASALVFLIGGGWLMVQIAPQWASAGAWVAATLHVFMVGLLLALRYQFGSWHRKQLLDPR